MGKRRKGREKRERDWWCRGRSEEVKWVRHGMTLRLWEERAEGVREGGRWEGGKDTSS